MTVPQTFEVVITDDGSTDGTQDMIKRARFPIFLKYLRADGNLGRAENRNRGFAKTVGGYIIFLDGDMIPGPSLVESHISMWERFPDDVVVGSIRNPPEWKLDRLHSYLYSRGRLTSKKESIIPGRYFTSNNFSISKKVFERLSGFDVSFKGWGGEDTDFGLRLEKEGLKIRYQPEAACNHYHRRSIDELLKEFEEYGRTGYRKLIEKHPDSVIFPRGWMLGLPDSKPGAIKSLVAGCMRPLRSDLVLSALRSLSGVTGITDLYFDWLFYGALVRGFEKGAHETGI
jgi:GT2 family glycosyltransferase